MNWSQSEILALATKAARGGGAPPWQAAAFGRAAVIHLAEGRPPDDLGEALGALPGGPILEIPLRLMALVQEAGGVNATLRCVDATALIHSYLDALPCVAHVSVASAAFDVTLMPGIPTIRRPAKRLAMQQDLHDLMQRLAARTYVPETEASRAGGAGAGLLDND